MATDEEIEKTILGHLASTEYACSSLTRLNGGTANFVYRGRLLSSSTAVASHDGNGAPEDEVVVVVVVKHTTDYVALNRGFKLDRDRCLFEEAMLRALNSFSPVRDTLLSPPITVKTPKLFHFDAATCTQIMEYLPNSQTLKSWLLSEEKGKKISEPAARAMGHALGSWIGAFHTWASHEQQSDLREEIGKNTAMQMLKNMVNYEKLPTMVDKYPHILESSRAVFEQVGERAAEEISSPPTNSDGGKIDDDDDDDGRYGLIHGDFWTGNVLITDHTLFVVDWELSHLGLRALDLGQMLAELFEAKHFKDVDAAVWIMEGLVEKYAPLTREIAFRAAMHVGVHLVCWSDVPGWGTQTQVEDVVRIGRDFVVKAWERDEDWFVQDGTLSFLFR